MIFYIYEGQLYPGMDGAQVFPTFVLQLRKKLEKTQPGKLTGRGSNSGPLVERLSYHGDISFGAKIPQTVMKLTLSISEWIYLGFPPTVRRNQGRLLQSSTFSRLGLL